MKPHKARAIVDTLTAYPHRLQNKPLGTSYRLAEPGDPLPDEPGTNLDVDEPHDANVITSEIVDGEHAGMHTIMLDLDVPARLIPSSTPGHFHLYIDKPIDWPHYSKILAALANAEVIEPAYEAVSQGRGHTALRLPWIAK